MHNEKVCQICYKKFTRKWNLERHLDDNHQIHNDFSNARMKQEIEMFDQFSNIVEPKHKFLNKEDNKMKEMLQYNQSYYNNNNLPNNLPYYYYGFDNNISSYPYSNINFQYNEEEKEKGEKRLSIDDKIRIQKVLKILEDYLEKLYPRWFIFQVLSWLHYQCRIQKSDEPLKKFLVQKI
ncbi:MAG TPA: hypothetical protein VHJ38_16645 [Nitrososphaeraceae archaeon]|nr:hypothetical protein [Nitrososphaeraceae archaeon]